MNARAWTDRKLVSTLKPGDRFAYGARALEVAIIRKGRLIVSIDAIDHSGHYAGTIDLPSDALVTVP